MPIESTKLTERIAVNFTENEALDLMEQAASEDRTVAEYIRLELRKRLYGVSKRKGRESKESLSAFAALRGTDDS